ncbi:hypothetical protein PRZ48_013579 [Zasmidium cellare]|uniref:Uncharacterized protein n=1 Tax=Zasmidium cellare TaxID=395010 RepID=A0ABR0E1U0_ZASCE|nr:hypothetical protein PRZ48_013579 [Zasmidium cellare]
MASNSFQGKIAIVTGASRGIGREIAIQFAKKGAQGVAITYLSNAKVAESTVSEIEATGSKAIAIQTPANFDTATAESVIQKTLQAFSVTGIDILVNNAGNMSLYPMGQLTAEVFHTMFSTNVLAPLLLTQATLPVIDPGGSIINISSRAARVAVGGQATLYAASKAALEHMTRNLATAHAAEKKITINNVMPGGIETDMISTAPQAMIDRVKNDATAEKRLGRVDEVADVVLFVAGGGGARWINGDTISVCGGAAMW